MGINVDQHGRAQTLITVGTPLGEEWVLGLKEGRLLFIVHSFRHFYFLTMGVYHLVKLVNKSPNTINTAKDTWYIIQFNDTFWG